MSSFNRLAGFTLAETLITLGIVGIVASMVVPVVMNNVRDKQLESQAAKAKYTLANGYKLMMNRQEIFNIKDIEFLSACTLLNNVNCVASAHQKHFKILKDTTGSLKVENLPESYSIENSTKNANFKWADAKYIFTTVDGAIYGLVSSADNMTIDVVTDINGVKKPNIALKDLKKYRMSGYGKIFDVSEELVAGECSWDNLDACTTQEQCMAVTVPESVQNFQGYWWEFEWTYNKCRAYKGG